MGDGSHVITVEVELDYVARCFYFLSEGYAAQWPTLWRK
jgi:hypothetical protein